MEQAEKERKKTQKEIESSLKRAEKRFKSEDYAEAASIYQAIAKLAETINDKRAIDFCIEEAKCYAKLGKDFNVGWAYKSAAVYAFAFSDFSNVINFATKAIEHFLKMDSLYAVQWCYNLMGDAGEKTGNYELAVNNYRKSLDIEYSEEIEKKLNRLLDIIPHVTVQQECEKKAAREGDKVEVVLKIKNDTKDTMNDIKVLGEKANELEAITSLKPGETRAFSYTMVAWEHSKPLYRKMTWKDGKGEKRERDVWPPSICVIPNIDVRPCLKEKLEIGKESYFVLSIENNSKNPIEDIEITVKFPFELKTEPVTGNYIDRISPREERGFVFKILPMTVGRTMLEPVLSFKDARGRTFRKKMKPFVLEETLDSSLDLPVKINLPQTVDKGDFNRLRYTEKFKRYLESFIQPKTIDEAEYIKLTKQLHSAIRGYTLKDVNVEKIANHIIEEYKGMSLVAEHVYEDERLYMFSGESKDGAIYLLTAVAKEDEDLVHVALKLYSGKEDELEDMLEKLSDILKYTVIAMSFATEIQKIEVKETINIIDSVVQRSKIGERIKKKDKELDIKDSVVQRTEV